MSRVLDVSPLESFDCSHTVAADFGLGERFSRCKTTVPGEGVHWRMMPWLEPWAWRFATGAGAGPVAVSASFEGPAERPAGLKNSTW